MTPGGLADYVWPYRAGGGSHAIYRNAVDCKHISEVNVLLNEIPAGGQVDVLLSPIHSLPSRKVELSNPRLQVGDNTITFPVCLQSGQYIELEQLDDCVLYDERGELIRRFRPQVDAAPRLVEGRNSLRFDCEPPQDASARAEVTVVSLGTSFGTRRDAGQIGWKYLNRQYDVPRIVTRIDGADNVWSIVRRADGPKGRQDGPPRIELEIKVEQLGPSEVEGEVPQLTTPVLTIGEASVGFPVKLLAGQRLLCRAQSHWRVLSADGEEVASGELSESLPTLVPGANRIAIGFEKVSSSDFRVVVKTAEVY